MNESKTARPQHRERLLDLSSKEVVSRPSLLDLPRVREVALPPQADALLPADTDDALARE